MPQREKIMKRLLRNVKQARPAGERDKTVEWIEKHLRSGKPQAAASAAMMLDNVAHWDALNGCHAVLHGDRAEGWLLLERTAVYRWWASRILPSAMDAREGAHRLAHVFVLLGHEAMARWLAARLLRSVDDGSLGSWEWSPFAVFIIELWNLHETGALKLRDRHQPSLAKLGVYEQVFENWHEPNGLTTALLNACDYHIDEATYSDADKEFLASPYDLFPVDILAIARVRERQGLPMPKLDHPLMRTPLAHPPHPNERRLPLPPDPLLDAVIAKARTKGLLPPPGGDDDFAI